MENIEELVETLSKRSQFNNDLSEEVHDNSYQFKNIFQTLDKQKFKRVNDETSQVTSCSNESLRETSSEQNSTQRSKVNFPPHEGSTDQLSLIQSSLIPLAESQMTQEQPSTLNQTKSQWQSRSQQNLIFMKSRPQTSKKLFKPFKSTLSVNSGVSQQELVERLSRLNLQFCKTVGQSDKEKESEMKRIKVKPEPKSDKPPTEVKFRWISAAYTRNSRFPQSMKKEKSIQTNKERMAATQMMNTNSPKQSIRQFQTTVVGFCTPVQGLSHNRQWGSQVFNQSSYRPNQGWIGSIQKRSIDLVPKVEKPKVFIKLKQKPLKKIFLPELGITQKTLNKSPQKPSIEFKKFKSSVNLGKKLLKPKSSQVQLISSQL